MGNDIGNCYSYRTGTVMDKVPVHIRIPQLVRKSVTVLVEAVTQPVTLQASPARVVTGITAVTVIFVLAMLSRHHPRTGRHRLLMSRALAVSLHEKVCRLCRELIILP